MNKDISAEDYFSFAYPDDNGDKALDNLLRPVNSTIIPTIADTDFSLPLGYSDSHLSPTFNSSVYHVIENAKKYILERWSALSIHDQQLKAAPLAASSSESDTSNLQDALAKLELLVQLLDNFARLAVKSNARDVTFRDRARTVDQMHQVEGEMRGLIEYLEPIVRDSRVKAC